MKRKYIIAVVLSSTVLAVDQYLKYLVRARMKIGQNIPIIDDFFSLHYLVNDGAAFGLFQGMHAIFFLGVGVLALGMIVYYLIVAEDSKLFCPICLALVLGGAMGNITDRLVLGEVTDFLLFEATFLGEGVVGFLEKHAGSKYWPSFNMADTTIVAGIIGMSIDLFFFTAIESENTEEEQSPENPGEPVES